MDVVIVDGRARADCAIEILPYLSSETVLFIHDWIDSRMGGLDQYDKVLFSIYMTCCPLFSSCLERQDPPLESAPGCTLYSPSFPPPHLPFSTHHTASLFSSPLHTPLHPSRTSSPHFPKGFTTGQIAQLSPCQVEIITLSAADLGRGKTLVPQEGLCGMRVGVETLRRRGWREGVGKYESAGQGEVTHWFILGWVGGGMQVL